jgi:hypothetical protein
MLYLATSPLFSGIGGTGSFTGTFGSDDLQFLHKVTAGWIGICGGGGGGGIEW